MKIQRVETYPLFYPLTRPYGDANGYKHYRAIFLIKITTESGITGWGECTDWLPTLQISFEHRIVPFLTGKLATEHHRLVAQIKKWHPRAATAVSMALTEIVAKFAGLSVCDLWGGKWTNTVPVYASFQSYSEETNWIKQSTRLIEQALERGFCQIKVKVGGKTLDEDQLHIGYVQELLISEHKLIIDANQSYDFATAGQWERLFSQWENVLWFEEPLPLNRIADYKMLRAHLSVPIAGGENLRSTADVLSLLCERSIDIIQPDILHNEGISDYRDTLHVSRYFGIRVSPHTSDGILSRLYALFAHACLPPWTKMDRGNIEPVEWDVMDNPLTSLIPIEPVNGQVTVPNGIGIGIELDESAIEKYRWDGSAY